MRTTLYIIILAVIFSCNKKNEKRVGILQKTKIDSITSVHELSNFIQKADSSLNNFSYITPQLYKKDFYSTLKLKQKLDRIFPKSNFLKVDFDNNGYTDIILTGEVGFSYHVFALMSYGNNKYSSIELTLPDFPTDFPVYPKLVYINETPAIELYTKGSSCLEQENQIIKETLIYKHNTFLEYNEKPQDLDVCKIEFRRTGCYGSCPVFNLTLRADSISNFRAIAYNYKPSRDKILNKILKATMEIKDSKEQMKIKDNIIHNEVMKDKDFLVFKEIKGNYEMKFVKKDFEEICQIIDYLNFDKLEKKCNVTTACGEASFFKIYFKDGTSKTISIFERIDIRGLSLLYYKLSDLRFNQKWKKI
jgi:hypothetical protein